MYYIGIECLQMILHRISLYIITNIFHIVDSAIDEMVQLRGQMEHMSTNPTEEEHFVLLCSCLRSVNLFMEWTV